MAQNVWKKQAEANKASQPPKPPGGGNPPPWMKNKVQQNQAVQQVPDTPQVNATQPTPPLTQPVAQQGPPGTQKPASTPAWMKNKQQGGQPPTATNLPPFAKPPGTGTAPTTAGTAPAWMKNKPSQSPMSTDRKMQDQKAKQEQEQKKRKQQQVRKQEQLKREQKQRKMMQVEEQISKIREQEDKKKPQKKKSPTKKSSQQKSPMKNLKRIKNGTPFHNYLLTLGPCLSKHTWYQDKINLQQQFIKNINVLAENLKRSLSAYLVQYKPVLRKKNIINLQNVVAEYALVEGVSGDNGSMYFKHKMVQALQIKFMCYQALFYCISKLIKKNGEFRVRVPLLNWLEVKGMYFLCQGVCEQLLDAVASPADNYVDIHGQLTQLEKQLKDSGYVNIDRKLFSVKKVIVADQQFYIIYLSQNFDYSIHAPNPSSLTCQTFQPFIPTTLPALTNLSLLSTGTQSFPFSLMKPSAINPIVSHTAPKLKQAFLNLFQVAHALRVVYASCQGELQQLIFWKLVFDGNRDIWTMAAAVGDVYGMTNIPQFKLIKEGKEVKVRNRMMLAKILETMLPIKFGVGRQVPSQMFGSPKRANKEEQGRKIPYHIESFIKVRAYPINCFELYEVSHLFPKTISNPSKNKLSQQSLALQSEIINSSSQIYFNRLDYLMNKSLLLFQKGLLTENGDTILQALKILQEYQIIRGSEIQKVGLWMALIRLHMEAAQAGLYPSSPQPHNTPMSEQKQKQNQTNSLSNRFDKSKLEQSEVRQIENSLELKRQKDRKYTQEDVYNKQSQMKRKSPSTNKIQQVDTDYQNSMLHFFSKLLAFIQELFEDQGQTWLHAELYMVLASYYSKRGLESSNAKKNNKNARNNQKQQQRDEPIRIQQQAKLSYFNRKTGMEKQKVYSKSHVLERKDGRQQHEKSQKQSDVQSLAESELQLSPKTPSNSHPYCKQCTKLLQLSYPIFLQYFGNQSEQLAEFLINQSQIYYNVNDLPKCEASITEALKIYKNKSLSKNGKNIIICNTILGKTLIKRGKAEANGEIIAKGIGLLEGIVDDMGGIGLAGDAEVMAVYQFLCQNVSANLSKAHVKSKSRDQFDMEGAKQTKMQLYMQKMAQMSISSGNIHTIKQVISKIVKSELQFYSKQRAVVLKQLHERFMKQNLSDKREQSEQNEQQMLQMNLQGIKYLQQNKQNYGGLIEMIKWSFGILRSKSESVEVNKATQIMENVLGFFREKQILGLLCL